MTHWHAYEPPLASAAIEFSIIGLACIALIAGLMWLGRWCVSFFEADSCEDDDFSEDVHPAEGPRGDGEGRRRTTGGFMVGSGAPPADAESC